jgi:tetratricopeptide (TPR) repeat protein
MNQMEAADKAFAKAIDLNYTDPRLYFNYGIVKQQQGKQLEAEKIFRKGLKASPMHEDLNYALVALLLQMNRDREAMEPAMILKKANPSNPDYGPLFKRLRI